MAVFARTGKYYIPFQAGFNLLNLVKLYLCEGCPISVGGEPPAFTLNAGLCFDDFELVDTLTAAIASVNPSTYIPLNEEADPGYCDGHIEGPTYEGTPVASTPQLVFDQITFTAAAAASYFGCALVINTGSGDQLLGIMKFDAPVDLAIGDIVKVFGTLDLPAALPPTA